MPLIPESNGEDALRRPTRKDGPNQHRFANDDKSGPTMPRVRAEVLARGAARVLDGRDGELEDELFLRAGFE